MENKTNPVVAVLVGTVCVANLGIIFFPIFAARRWVDPAQSCASNLKQCTIGQVVYAVDFDDRLPSCTTWMDSIKDYTKNEGIYHCPQIKDPKKDDYGYAMNVAVSLIDTKKVARPEEVPVLFDSLLLARNACSGFYGFPDPKDRGTIVGYVDGHVRSLGKR